MAPGGDRERPVSRADGRGRRRTLLARLTQVEAFEQFLHRTFPGKTRFSIEGADMLVPMLDELIRLAASDGIRTVQLGMAHRGRLNVMAHIVGKPYAAILAEFKEPLDARPARDDVGWTGDVTYHKGARTDPGTSGPDRVTVMLAPNPSHLEAVDPVVLGMTRAAAARTDQAGAPRWEFGTALAVLIHGDASFHGQGVVAESLNLSRLRGYEVGGTLHIIVNNQLGYTATSGGNPRRPARKRLGERIRHPDRPRERRRPRGMPCGDPAGCRLSAAVSQGRPDRPRGVSPLRPQRGRRADLHAAADV